MVEDLQIVLLNKSPASALPVRLLANQLNQQIFTPSQPSIASELIVGGSCLHLQKNHEAFCALVEKFYDLPLVRSASQKRAF